MGPPVPWALPLSGTRCISGAEVYATAGNDEKRMIAELSGVRPDRIFDSRSLPTPTRSWS